VLAAELLPIIVEPLNKFMCISSALFKPTLQSNIAKILLEVEDGVMAKDKFGTSTKLSEVVAKLTDVLVDKTCKTLPVAIAAGKAVTAPKDALAILP